MKEYHIRAEWDERLPYEDLVRAREAFELDLRDSMDHMEFENLRVDVQQIPTEHYEGGQSGPLIPHMSVGHPWDQGAWIFPEDHPLAGYERAAKMNDKPEEKQAFLEAGRKMLPPPMEPDDDR